MNTSVQYSRAELGKAALGLYAGLVEQARKPDFYRVCGVPDTLDGRYEMIVLHAFLLLHRLSRDKGVNAASRLGQILFDTMFADMDQNLREMGAGDLGVGRRVKTMARGFYGRTAAYEGALAGPDSALGGALRRNLYGSLAEDELPSQEVLVAMAAYVRRESETLQEVGFSALVKGWPGFGPPPSRPGAAR